MRVRLTIAVVVALLMQPISNAQEIPPVQASSNPLFHLPIIAGVFHYAITASDLYESGRAIPGGPAHVGSISGNLAYQSQNVRRPLSLLYAGGWSASTDPAMTSMMFHNLMLAQNLIAGRWSFGVSNTFTYLPYSPSTGLSGVPGLGDLGSPTVPGNPAPVPTLLSNYAKRIDNSLTAEVSRHVDAWTSVTGKMTWGEEHFLTGTGLNTSLVAGTLGVNRRLSARSNVDFNYAYSQFAYSHGLFSFDTQGFNFFAQHQWTRALSASASVGPQWLGSSDSTAVPPHVALAATASATYTRALKSAQIDYYRGAVSGFGIVPGAFSNSLGGQAQESFGRQWGAAVSGSYTAISGLGPVSPVQEIPGSSGKGNTKYVSLQATRAIGRSTTAYASYTVQYQSLDPSLGARNALNGLAQIFGTGITFGSESRASRQF